MKIEHFYDKGLAHGSFAILSNGEVALVDPARNPQPYYEFAKENNATIKYVIETHPHADFVSSHCEIRKSTGATILCSKLLGAEYEHQSFDDGDGVTLGDVTLKAFNTPGHSPDSITILLEDSEGKQHSIFTGDTLFIGDVGRPDLREAVGNIQAQREVLARDMYRSTRNVLMKLQENVIVYPAHGAGSLCGKALSSDLTSTLGEQFKSNYALQPMNEDEFVKVLLEGQPFIPKYFPYDVTLNKKGAPGYQESLDKIARTDYYEVPEGILVVDTRPEDMFKAGHLAGSINLPDGEKFESWLGSIVSGDEKFVMVCENEDFREYLLSRAAKIGYDLNIIAATLSVQDMSEVYEKIDFADFHQNEDKYEVIDVRNMEEFNAGGVFAHAVNLPLPFIREQLADFDTSRDIVVHCRAGYRSAVGSSIVHSLLGKKVKVYDLSTSISKYM